LARFRSFGTEVARSNYLRMHADSRRSVDLPIEQAEVAVEVFQMLSDTTRVRLVWALTD
jgi:hypothetical protein